MSPLAIDLFCGLGGWTEGLLDEGFEVIGFDIERHAYGSERYPAQLVIQDVLTIHGSQFRNASLIVASPPCQEFSYMAMPWTRAKQIAAALRGNGDFPEGYKGSRTVAELTALFDACFRIQREASEAAGRHIPMVVENVKGAQPWVGKARWLYGSFALWGDVPALMPKPHKARKVPGFRFDGSGKSFQTASVDGMKANPDGTNHGTGSWFKIADSKNRGASEKAHREISPAWRAKHYDQTEKMALTNQREHDAVRDGVKQAGIGGVRENGKGDAWFQDGAARHGSKSTARKAASAQIAKIPARLSRHIARYYFPYEQERTA